MPRQKTWRQADRRYRLDFNIYAITNLVCLAKDEACSAPTLDQQSLQSHGQIRGRSRREDQ
jgi:hypothetical protein